MNELYLLFLFWKKNWLDTHEKKVTEKSLCGAAHGNLPPNQQRIPKISFPPIFDFSSSFGMLSTK